MAKQEFYIGWMERAPVGVARFVKNYLFFLIAIAVITGILLSTNQKKFSRANFEFGKTTVVKGIYAASPVPHILVPDQKDYVMVLLVGYGKHGAEGVMKDLEVQSSTSLNGREVSLKGTLLYGDGKILMQVDRNDNPLVSVSVPINRIPSNETDRGEVNLKGEIIDPKCYFGVMKPGAGKVHKDCAIRCILGGIPPVLKITNEKGENSYVLLTGDNINERVKDFVAVPSEVTGHLKKYNDWEILELSAIHNLNATTYLVSASGNGCSKK